MRRDRLWGVALTLLLVSCTSSTNPDLQLTATPTLTTPVEQGTAVASDSNFMSPTPSSSSTPSKLTSLSQLGLLPLPKRLEDNLNDGLILSEPVNPDCQLPCWEALRVGISSAKDVTKIFEDSFELNNNVDYLNPLDEEARRLKNLDFQNMDAIGYAWNLASGGSYQVYAVIDTKTKILKGIKIDYLKFSKSGRAHSLEQIIKKLGIPSAAYAYATDGVLTMVTIYSGGGIAFYTVNDASVQTKTVNGIQTRFSRFCLDQSVAAGQDYLVEPFAQPFNSKALTPVQEKWIGPTISELPQLQDTLGVSLEEFTRIVSTNNPPCFNVNYK